MFEQLAVLDDILPLLADGPLPDGPAAAASLACRLLSERSTALHDPGRRARFVAAARTTLATHGIDYAPDPAQGISAGWALELEGTLPLSVIVVWDGHDTGPLAATLTALVRQRGPGFELLVHCTDRTGRTGPDHATRTLQTHCPAWTDGWARVVGPATGPASDPATDADPALAQARGRFVAWCEAGDLPDPWALHDRTEALLATGAEISLSARRHGPDARPHAGFEPDHVPAHTHTPVPFTARPRQALAADLALSGVVFDRAFLDTHGLRPAACGRHGDWPLILGALLLAEQAVYLPEPDVTIRPDQAARAGLARPYPLYRLARDHARLCAAMPAIAVYALPRGWERRLLARALRRWLLEGPVRGRAGQALAQLGAAALLALLRARGGERLGAGFLLSLRQGAMDLRPSPARLTRALCALAAGGRRTAARGAARFPLGRCRTLATARTGRGCKRRPAPWRGGFRAWRRRCLHLGAADDPRPARHVESLRGQLLGGRGIVRRRGRCSRFGGNFRRRFGLRRLSLRLSLGSRGRRRRSGRGSGFGGRLCIGSRGGGGSGLARRSIARSGSVTLSGHHHTALLLLHHNRLGPTVGEALTGRRLLHTAAAQTQGLLAPRNLFAGVVRFAHTVKCPANTCSSGCSRLSATSNGPNS